MFNVRLAGGHLYGKQLDVLNGIWDLIESVSEGFLTYSCAEHEQPGDRWAPLGEILPGINPMILLDQIGRSSGLQ